jgi:integrase
MPRRPGVQITRNRRHDGSTTYALRVRVGGSDERVPLGNTNDGWDEARAERARGQLLAKIELGLWNPRAGGPHGDYEEEPTFRELATDWFEGRQANPAIRPATISGDLWALTRYLLPFFGELLPSQITPLTVKRYRRRIHEENVQIRAAIEAGEPFRDRRGRPLRPLSNSSINKTLLTLAAVLDDAEDAGWVQRNVARGRRTREPVERHHADVLSPEEFESLLEAAGELDAQHHRARTVERAEQIRQLREAQLTWKEIAAKVGVAPTTAIYLHRCEQPPPEIGARRAIVATLGLSGLRVTELCQLEQRHVHLAARKIHVREAKTDAGIRAVDIRPRLLEELTAYNAARGDVDLVAPAFPTKTGRHRDKDNVRERLIRPVVARANELRTQRGEPPILAHVTPHTLRRTYISFMLAAGFDLPYVQEQVGHEDPTTTLKIYAQVIRRPDRDNLRADMRALLGEDRPGIAPAPEPPPATELVPSQVAKEPRAANETAGKGRGGAL